MARNTRTTGCSAASSSTSIRPPSFSISASAVLTSGRGTAGGFGPLLRLGGHRRRGRMGGFFSRIRAGPRTDDRDGHEQCRQDHRQQVLGHGAVSPAKRTDRKGRLVRNRHRSSAPGNRVAAGRLEVRTGSRHRPAAPSGRNRSIFNVGQESRSLHNSCQWLVYGGPRAFCHPPDCGRNRRVRTAGIGCRGTRPRMRRSNLTVRSEAEDRSVASR